MAEVPKVPKFSSAQTKLIRTFEGILVSVFGVALIVATTITQTLSPAQGAKWGGVVAAATIIGRQIGKGFAAAQAPYLSEDATVIATEVEASSTPNDESLVAKPGSALPPDEFPPDVTVPSDPPVAPAQTAAPTHRKPR